MTHLTDPLDLPCGLRLPNRLGRAAMTEGLADARNDVSPRLERLYAAHARGGAGLVLTGNVMVDRRYLERARNVVVDASTDEAALRRWAAACSATPTLVQLGHSGRQTNRFVHARPVAPSAGPAVALAGLFASPRALTSEEVHEVRDRFVDAGRRVVDAGFAGVQLHAAHGYLLSTFLDPERNRRDDAYGGDVGRRARLLLEVVEGLRAVLPSRAAVAVKMDARDGAEDDLASVARWLEEAGADLLEVSGGSYESPAMLGLDARGAELRSVEESPFWHGAAVVAGATSMPVMLTGGFRTRAALDQALASGVAAVVGVGRPLAVRPALAGQVLRGEVDELDRPAPRLTGPRLVRRLGGAAANSGWHRLQMARTAEGEGPRLGLPALAAATDYVLVDGGQALLARRSRMRLAAATPPPPPVPAQTG